MAGGLSRNFNAKAIAAAMSAAVWFCSGSVAFAQSDPLLDALINRDLPGSDDDETTTPTPLVIGANGPEIPLVSPDEELLRDILGVQDLNVIDRAFPFLESKWPDNFVYVCWEEMPEQDEGKRLWVREAAEGSWEAASGLDFRGWQACFDGSAGVRIRVADEGPKVLQLGKFLDGVPGGMVLNFTFENWNTDCQETVEECIRAIAVHEFGHAIGFAHEQNRADTPGECLEFPDGPDGDTLLTPWDPNSVMNYCNEVRNNDGILSELDAEAVRTIYGEPS